MDTFLWAPLPLRLALGVIFVAHGSQKAFGAFNGPGLAGFTKLLDSMGIPLAGFMAVVVMLVELVGGVCLFLGIGTRIAAALIAVNMLVAIFKVHLTKGLFDMEGGFEYPLVILAACITLVILGGGALSLTKF